MLKSINTIYIFSSLFLYFSLTSKISGEYILINILAIFSFICYFGTLELNRIANSKSDTYSSLTIQVFLYIFVFVFLENSISYFYAGNFLVFSTSDATFYHDSVMEIIDMPFIDGIKHYLTYMTYDDLGMILILYPLSLISDSNLMLNMFYLFVGVIIALSLFSLSQQFMSKKYAFLTALSFATSSFILFFHASGLKESFMIMLIILAFDFYYRFINNKTIVNLLGSLLFLGMILLFRPAVLGMIVISIGLGALFSSRGGAGVKVVALLIFLFLAFMSQSILTIIQDYTTGGLDTLIEAREVQGSIIGGLSFTYVVNVLSQAVGPFPTLISSKKILTMFYAPSLIYRILLSFPFWFGMVYIYKNKWTQMYPLTLFIGLEMLALIFLIDGLELRKAMPHIPIIFVISFWFMDQYDRKIIRLKKIKRFKQFFQFSIFLLVLLIFYWNFR